MDDTFNVILNGVILDGYNYASVIDQLSKLFKLDIHKATSFLDGKRHVIKKGVDKETAEKYKKALLLVGVSCDLEIINHNLDIDPKESSPAHSMENSNTKQYSTNEIKYCSTCGSKLGISANYCHECGACAHQELTYPKSKPTSLYNQEINPSLHQVDKIANNTELGFWYYALLPFKRFATFDGRSRRREYWSFFLFCIIVQFCISFVMGFIKGFVIAASRGQAGYGISQWENFILFVFFLVIFIPSIAVGVRRLHDVNRSGWWLLLPIVNFIMLTLAGDPEKNKYGLSEK